MAGEMTKDTGGQAFPTNEIYGMSLRDYFAARALNGIISGSSHRYRIGSGAKPMWSSSAAVEAYELADAMLAERAK